MIVGLLNAASLARGLDVSGHSIAHYLDILVDLLLVRRLPPWHANVGKRLVKSPKIYIRDSGFLHALLNISSLNELFGHPIVGNSWEGYVVENLISVYAEQRYTPYFYRTQTGAEIDLIFEKGGARDERYRRRLHRQHLSAQQGSPKRESAKVSRILHRFHSHGLIAKYMPREIALVFQKSTLSFAVSMRGPVYVKTFPLATFQP